MATVSRFRAAASVYFSWRMVVLFFLGLSSGLPRLLVYSTLSFWLLREGLSIGAVGLFALTSTPYSAKVLWAPVVDRLPLPLLRRLFGQRRSWIGLTQACLAGSILALAMSDPGEDPVLAATLAIVVAAFSATQDIVIDAYRVDILPDDEQGAGAATAVFGYRVGMLIASAGALLTVAFIDSWPMGMVWVPLSSWQAVYAVMAVVMALCGVATLLAPREPDRASLRSLSEGEQSDKKSQSRIDVIHEIFDAVIGPLKNFLSRRGWFVLLAFAVLYKVGDALCGTMTNPFLTDIGFSEAEIATVAKTYGLFATLAGVALGGAVVRGLGVVKALWVAGFIQLASNLMFALQAVVGLDTWMLAATIGIENLTGGVGTAAFVAYLSGLCDRRYTATQYALLTAMAATSKTLLSSGSGFLAEYLGWVQYFIATTGAAVPGLVLLFFMMRWKMTGIDATDRGAQLGEKGEP